MNIQQFRHFVTVAKLLHFGRAASELHMTQPPLSQSIRRLERDLGVGLFDRSKQRVALTSAGVMLVPVAESILKRYEIAKSRVAAAAARTAPGLVISYTEDALAAALPAIARKLQNEHPNARIRLVEQDGVSPFADLTSERVDLILSYAAAPPRTNLSSLAISTGRLLAALRPNEAIAGDNSIPFESLLDAPLILFPREHAPAAYDRILGLRGGNDDQQTRVDHSLGSSHARLRLVSAGLGRSLVSSCIASYYSGDLVFRPVDGLEDAAMTLHLSWNPKSRNALARWVGRTMPELGKG